MVLVGVTQVSRGGEIGDPAIEGVEYIDLSLLSGA